MDGTHGEKQNRNTMEKVEKVYYSVTSDFYIETFMSEERFVARCHRFRPLSVKKSEHKYFKVQLMQSEWVCSSLLTQLFSRFVASF